jgi:hypothetical protein
MGSQLRLCVNLLRYPHPASPPRSRPASEDTKGNARAAQGRLPTSRFASSRNPRNSLFSPRKNPSRRCLKGRNRGDCSTNSDPAATPSRPFIAKHRDPRRLRRHFLALKHRQASAKISGQNLLLKLPRRSVRVRMSSMTSCPCGATGACRPPSVFLGIPNQSARFAEPSRRQKTIPANAAHATPRMPPPACACIAHRSVPLLGTSSARAAGYASHCRSISSQGEKCR